MGNSNPYTLLNGDCPKLQAQNVFTQRQEIALSGDVKLIMRSTDADNTCYIEAQSADKKELSRFGYAGAKGWCIDGKPIQTTS